MSKDLDFKGMTYSDLSPLGRRAGGFREFETLLDAAYVADEVDTSNQSKEVRKDPNEQLFDVVFAVNPITRLPQGDIAVFMSENTSPDIKRFIEMQLHKPMQLDADVKAADLPNVSDDDIAYFTRNVNESIADYRQRVYQRIRSDYEAAQSKENPSA